MNFDIGQVLLELVDDQACAALPACTTTIERLELRAITYDGVLDVLGMSVERR